jgi:myosin heavy subunit
VSTHEHFREICAAATIGQATGEELYELEQHAEGCESCRQAYFDYLNLAAERYASASQNPSLSAQTAEASLDSELFTQRFFERAEREGIPFSEAVGREVRQITPRGQTNRSRIAWRGPLEAIAAVMLLGFSLSGAYFYGKQSEKQNVGTRPTSLGDEIGAIASLDRQIAELTTTNTKLELEVGQLKAALSKAEGQFETAQRDLHVTSEDREKLAAARAALETQLATAQNALAESQALVVSVQADARKHQEHASDVEATLVADKIKINDLTAELDAQANAADKERQLLALGHDVSDLMGARNLHIVDVVDTDPKGKTRPAFGRVFFTEGKSLVFYAYDLNEAKLEKANYQYHIWAKQEGADKQVRNLGIFYSDDKAQRRWVFKCNDTKVLNVIDSVFVTLEPADSDPSHPKGANLMYAYLRGQPNHP